MEALAWFFFILLVGGLGWLVFTEVNKEVEIQLPPSSDLNKMKKADLIAYAQENGMSVDPKSTKAVILEAIKNS